MKIRVRVTGAELLVIGEPAAASLPPFPELTDETMAASRHSRTPWDGRVNLALYLI
jgi:hypothetical protein